MFARRNWLSLALVAIAPLLARGEPPSPALLQEYFLPPELSSPALSPTGEYLGCIVRKGDVYGMGVYTFATREFSLIGGTKDKQVFAFWWKGPRRLLLGITNEKRDGRNLTAIDIDGEHASSLWRLAAVPGVILDGLPDDPRHVLVRNTGEVLLVDIESGSTITVDHSVEGRAFKLFTDNTHRFRAAYLHDYEGNQTVKWKAPGASGDEWHRTAFTPDERGFRPFAFDEDPRYLWVWDYTQGSETVAARLDTVSGERVVVARNPDCDVTDALLCGRFDEPIAAVYSQALPVKILPLVPKYATAVQNLQQRFAGFYPVIVDSLADRRTWVVWAGNSRLPGAYFLFDSQANQSSLISLTYSGELTEDRLAPAEQITIAGRSGQPLRGLVWRPAAVKQPPLLVFCPDRMPANPAQDLFDPVVQALVAHGVAVAKIDARGTYGYGKSYLAFADGYVTATLREDYEDFVHGLADHGYVEGTKTGLFGESLGGALALKLAASSDAFTAVVSIDAPAQLYRESLENFSQEFASSRTMAQLGGWVHAGKVADELSPIRVGPFLKKPALYLYSTEAHSATRLRASGPEMKRALEKAGVPASVGVAFGPGEYPRPASDVARDRANQITQIVTFLDKTWSAR